MCCYLYSYYVIVVIVCAASFFVGMKFIDTILQVSLCSVYIHSRPRSLNDCKEIYWRWLPIWRNRNTGIH